MPIDSRAATEALFTLSEEKAAVPRVMNSHFWFLLGVWSQFNFQLKFENKKSVYIILFWRIHQLGLVTHFSHKYQIQR